MTSQIFNQLPLVLEQKIMQMKYELEHVEKFKKTLNEIKNIKYNIRYEDGNDCMWPEANYVSTLIYNNVSTEYTYYNKTYNGDFNDNLRMDIWNDDGNGGCIELINGVFINDNGNDNVDNYFLRNKQNN